jgi:hypothetical protein
MIYETNPIPEISHFHHRGSLLVPSGVEFSKPRAEEYPLFYSATTNHYASPISIYSQPALNTTQATPAITGLRNKALWHPAQLLHALFYGVCR